MNRIRHRSLSLVLAAVAALTLAACGPAEESPLEPLGDDGADVAGATIHFFAQSEDLNTAMDALYEGPVARAEDGCLRLQLSESPTVVWPRGYSLEEGPGGKPRILDPDGHAVGGLGETFRLGGGIVPTLDEGMGLSEADIQRALESCPGRYWIVGDVLD